MFLYIVCIASCITINQVFVCITGYRPISNSILIHHQSLICTQWHCQLRYSIKLMFDGYKGLFIGYNNWLFSSEFSRLWASSLGVSCLSTNTAQSLLPLSISRSSLLSSSLTTPSATPTKARFLLLAPLKVPALFLSWLGTSVEYLSFVRPLLLYRFLYGYWTTFARDVGALHVRGPSLCVVCVVWGLWVRPAVVGRDSRRCVCPQEEVTASIKLGTLIKLSTCIAAKHNKAFNRKHPVIFYSIRM